jgi:hypothetical protein
VAQSVPSNYFIRAEEAIQALAIFNEDPRYAVWLKSEATSLLDTSSERYQRLFTPELTAFQLANSVRFFRYAQERMALEAIGYGPEVLTYRHGLPLYAWVLSKRVLAERNSARIFDPQALREKLGAAADDLRQLLWDETSKSLGSKTPLNLFRTQSHTLPLALKIMAKNYGLQDDAALAALRGRQEANEVYPRRQFNYLISKAPQFQVL